MATNIQEQYQRWLTHPGLPQDLQADLAAIAGDERGIQDRFYQDLEFGTGGLRGVLGAGTNRMNVYTVRRASRGFAEYLLEAVPDAATRGVVIGYDCRRMSPEFALETGLVMAAAGMRAYVFSHLCPTPELSYAVRTLGAAGGVMITASHNPPEYNGYKVYGPDGGQVLPEAAERILGKVERIADIFQIPLVTRAEAEKAGALTWVGAEIDEAYCERVVQSLRVGSLQAADRAALGVVYTPLHGTGHVPVRTVLTAAGYTNAYIVPEQAQPDGEFSTVKSPNPEEPEALKMAVEAARARGADLVMGTDPDADRVGIAARTPDGDYRLLTGNQTGGLLLDFLLRERSSLGLLPANPILFKTIVTSALGAAIAARHGVAVEDTLTGFKYIGDRIGHYEKTGEKTFLFGYEESYGYLIEPFVRDKDAVQSCLLIAEMAAWYKRQNLTLVQGLERIYGEVGWFEERLISLTMPGADGVAKIADKMRTLREQPLQIAGVDLQAVEDYLSSERLPVAAGAIDKQGTERLSLPQADVVKFLYHGGSWIAARPSGTEPKMKIYLGATGESKETCAAIMSAMSDAVRRLVP